MSKKSPQRQTVEDRDREEEKLESRESTGTASQPASETTAQAERKEAALNVLKTYLAAVIAGGTETNWELSSEAARASVLKQFPAEEQDKERFLAMFREGVAHEQLISYSVKEVTLVGGQVQVVISATRQNLTEMDESTRGDLKSTYSSTDTFKLIEENGQWKVDWVIGGVFKPF